MGIACAKAKMSRDRHFMFISEEEEQDEDEDDERRRNSLALFLHSSLTSSAVHLYLGKDIHSRLVCHRARRREILDQ